ncbi:MAG: trypsin-like peptidase domain-containing protein, partial [Terriglobales bacterium]
MIITRGMGWDRRCQGALLLASILIVGSATAQTQPGKAGGAHGLSQNGQPAPNAGQTDFLKQFNAAMEALAAKAAPAVVQVQATGFGLAEDDAGNKIAVISRQHILGSGVIVDPDGYIMTNAHVVRDAQRIEVVLTPASAGSSAPTRYTARLLGIHPETDLALLKIDAGVLPFLPLDPKHAAQQGELVAALGSPQGLGNSITMGI